MTSTAIDFDQLDLDIAAAWMTLGVTRRAWARSPNADSLAAEERAEATLNKLLEFRFVVKRDGAAE